MNVALVNGTELSYTRVGSGIPMICLHGGMGLDSQTLRTRGIEELSKQGFEVVIFDQRGHGPSQSVSSSELTHDTWASDVVALADYFGWDRFSLLGHSYGGFIALETATSWPDRLSHLILIATSAGPVQSPFPYCATNEELSTFFASRWPRFFLGEEKYWDVFERVTFSAAAFNAAFQTALPNYNVQAEIGEVTIPTLLIAGDHDPYLPAMRLMEKAMCTAQLSIVRDSGHMPFIEREVEFREAILLFFQSEKDHHAV